MTLCFFLSFILRLCAHYHFLRPDDLNTLDGWVDLLIQSIPSSQQREFTFSPWNGHRPWPLFGFYSLINDVKRSLSQNNILQASWCSGHYCSPNATHEPLGRAILSFILVGEKTFTWGTRLKQWPIFPAFIENNSSSNSESFWEREPNLLCQIPTVTSQYSLDAFIRRA